MAKKRTKKYRITQREAPRMGYAGLQERVVESDEPPEGYETCEELDDDAPVYNWRKVKTETLNDASNP